MQYVGTDDAQLWASEWIEKAYPDEPQFGSEVQTRKYTLSWRSIANSPQQDWQVKTDNKSSGAFVQISLDKPQLEFGISSTETLTDTEWKTIWKIWEQAFSTGIGCRFSAGYGQPRKRTGEVLYRVELQG